MDSVDPGALLAAMSSSGSGSATAGAGNLDAQIMALLKQTAPTADAGTSSASGNAQAAQTASSKPATLNVGIGPWLRTDTGIPLPHAINEGMVGAGAHVLRDLGLLRDPMAQAVAQQAQTEPSGQVGGLLGDTGLAVAGGTGLSGLLGTGALGAGAARLAARPLANTLMQGAAQGALTNPDDRGLGALSGAATGGVLHGVGAGLGKLATGINRTPEAQTLLDRNVPLTPGQMNPGGMYNRIEQALTSLPLVGGQIANARAAGLPAVTRAVVNDAMAPGSTLSANATDFNSMLNEAKTSLDNAYDSIHGYGASPAIVRVKGGNVPLSQAFRDVTQQPRLGLDANTRASMGQQLQDQLQETIAVAKKNGGMLSDHLQALRSQVRTASRNAPEAAQRDFWNAAQDKVTQALNSQLPPAAAQTLQAVDQQYSKFATLRQLAGAANDKEPTLSQLSTAIKQNTPPNVYAIGGGWNRDLTKAATSTFGGTVPMTGLTGEGTVRPITRAIGGLAEGAGGAAAFMHPHVAIPAAAPLAGLWGAYTQPGLRAFAGNTAPQRAVQGLLSRASPDVRRVLSQYARQGLTQGLMNTQQAQGGLLAQ